MNNYIARSLLGILTALVFISSAAGSVFPDNPGLRVPIGGMARIDKVFKDVGSRALKNSKNTIMLGQDISRNWLEAVKRGEIRVAFEREGEQIELGVKEDDNGQLEFYGFNRTRGLAIEESVVEKFIENFAVQFNGYRALRPGVSKEKDIGRQPDLQPHSKETCQFSCENPSDSKSLLNRKSLGDFLIEGTLWQAYNNAAPFEKEGHFLLVPDIKESQERRPQVLIKKDIADMVYLMRRSINLLLFFNSRHAGATVNHIHFQGVYLDKDMPLLRAGRGREFIYKSVEISRLLNYKIPGLCFESKNEADFTDAIWKAVELLQQEGKEKPFNLIFIEDKAYLFIRNIDHEVVEDFRTGVFASYEISGKIIVVDKNTYDAVTIGKLEKAFRETCLDYGQISRIFAGVFIDRGINRISNFRRTSTSN